jgi:hypothetical protein
MKDWGEELYRLLPAFHRVRDGQNGEPLRQFLGVIGQQVDLVQEDIERFYSNLFVETADDWVVPYIGDLVGFRRADDKGHAGDGIPEKSDLLNRVLFPRREIANLVRRRRRKGTLSVLEDIARDATDWPSRAVEFAGQVTFFQNVKHPEPKLGRTVDIRQHKKLVRLDTPFNKIAHTVDVRNMQSRPGIGWYHPKKVGLFVWRRKVYSSTLMRPCRVCHVGKHKRGYAYAFHRLGLSIPLYVRPQPETDSYGIANERNLPVPLYRHLLAGRNGRAVPEFYGLRGAVPKSVGIWVRWTGIASRSLIPANQVHVCDLTDRSRWPAIASSLSDGEAVIDPECGRFLLMPPKHLNNNPPFDVRVSYHSAFTGDIGGGEYQRDTPENPDRPTVRVQDEAAFSDVGVPHLFESSQSLLLQLQSAPVAPGRPQRGPSPLLHQPTASSAAQKGDCPIATWTVQDDVCLEIHDSATYQIPASESVQIAPGKTLEIRAAPNCWPMLVLFADEKHAYDAPWRVFLGRGSRLIIDGLLVCGCSLHVSDAQAGMNCRDETIPRPKENHDAALVPLAPDGGMAINCQNGTPRGISTTGTVIIRHATFAPCRSEVDFDCPFPLCLPSVTFDLQQTEARIRHSIIGTIHTRRDLCHSECSSDTQRQACPIEPLRLNISDSIVDAADDVAAVAEQLAAPIELTVARSTIRGAVHVQQIAAADDSLFDGEVRVTRRGIGYLRFCYVKDVKDRVVTPTRFKCIPVIASTRQENNCAAGCDSPTGGRTTVSSTTLQPEFVTRQYGQPGYFELSLESSPELLRGAEDESEIGVYHDLFDPQRRAAIEARLQEYTPADMQSAVIYADDLHPAHYRLSNGNPCFPILVAPREPASPASEE